MKALLSDLFDAAVAAVMHLPIAWPIFYRRPDRDELSWAAPAKPR